MIKYREVLRLHAQKVTQRGIASSTGHSRNTIREVLKRAKEKSIHWPLDSEITDLDLQIILYPEKQIHPIIVGNQMESIFIRNWLNQE